MIKIIPMDTVCATCPALIQAGTPAATAADGRPVPQCPECEGAPEILISATLDTLHRVPSGLHTL